MTNRMKYAMILLLVGCTTTPYTVRVIRTSTESQNHCIEGKRIVCEYKAPSVK